MQQSDTVFTEREWVPAYADEPERDRERRLIVFLALGLDCSVPVLHAFHYRTAPVVVNDAFAPHFYAMQIVYLHRYALRSAGAWVSLCEGALLRHIDSTNAIIGNIAAHSMDVCIALPWRRHILKLHTVPMLQLQENDDQPFMLYRHHVAVQCEAALRRLIHLCENPFVD